MKNPEVIFILISFLLISACKSSFDPLMPYGVKSELELKAESELNAELILVNSNYLYVLVQNNLIKIDLQEITQIYAQELEYKNRKIMLVFSGIGAALLGVGLEDPFWKTTSFGLGFYGFFSALNGIEKYKFKPPLSNKKLEILKLYCRYPQGLSPAQLKYLEDYYNQDEREDH